MRSLRARHRSARYLLRKIRSNIEDVGLALAPVALLRRGGHRLRRSRRLLHDALLNVEWRRLDRRETLVGVVARRNQFLRFRSAFLAVLRLLRHRRLRFAALGRRLRLRLRAATVEARAADGEEDDDRYRGDDDDRCGRQSSF